MAISGIDVSRWQKGFKLINAKNDGFTKVIVKCGGADSGLYKDSQFDNFYNQAKELGMFLGVYYFGKAFSEAEAIKEANHCISLLQGKSVKYVFYDVEAKMLNQGKTHLTNIIKAFAQTITKAGYVCGVYTSESHFNNQINDRELKDYIHWVARYSKSAPKLNSGNEIAIWQYGGEVNYIRSNKIAGTVVDQDYIYKDFDLNTEVVGGNPDKFSTHQLALEVLEGKWGNGEDRKKNLGSRYAEVQAEVERILKERANAPTTKTIDQLAVEVLAGLWGNGITRKIKLGKNYDAVQKRVEEIIAERKQKKKVYVVQKGDTLGKIAKRYNTTVEMLVDTNGIKDKNKIYPGQELVIA